LDLQRKRKKGGKKEEPTAEELEFIYSRIPKMSDSAILDEMQDEGFPLRTVGFIKRRRRELNAAKKVMEQPDSVKNDPLIMEARSKHFNDICCLLERVENVVENITCFNWGEFFGEEDTGKWVAPIDAGQDDNFTRTDWNDAAISKKVKDGRIIELKFGIEEHPLFSCLHNHIEDDVWKLYEDWRQLEWQLEQQYLSNKLAGKEFEYNEEIEKMYRIHEKLRDEIKDSFSKMRFRRIFSGKCDCCP